MPMRIAIACCGLEHVRRGYESFSRELYDALFANGADVVLFKGSGQSMEREFVVPCVRRDRIPMFVSPARAFYYEQISFAFALLPYLALKKIDVLHFSEGNVGNALGRLVRWLGLGVRLVQSNGGPHLPHHFRPEVYIHQVCKFGQDQAANSGIPANRMSLVPYGIKSKTFRSEVPKDELREQFGIPCGCFTILSLAALSKSHKRLDYLIEEISNVRGENVFLCMAGEPTSDTLELKELAAKLLPGRHMFLTVPRTKVPELLASADLFVHSALHEGFGMVLLEALSAGLPVVCHNTEHFRWVLGDAALFTDMGASNSLASTIRMVLDHPSVLEGMCHSARTRISELYEWDVLVPRYLEMYELALRS